MHAEHTPLPWVVNDQAYGGSQSDAQIVIHAADGRLVAMACTTHVGAVNAEKNAAYIVKAANNHAALLAALEDSLSLDGFTGAGMVEHFAKIRPGLLAAIDAAE